jgi:cystathionine beta-lyase/cystathionine gamma-synthase
MGATSISRSFPHMFLSNGNILYLFDAWPETFNLIRKIVKAYNIKILFISSKDSAERLQALLPGISVVWCPEGVRTKTYRSSEYPMKDIDPISL